MKQRTLDEMISYFNQQVSEMDIDRKYKIALLGMITAIGYEAQKKKWIPCSERLPEMGKTVLWCNKHGSVFVSSITFKAEKCEYFTVGKHFDVIAWQPLPEPYREAKHE